ncbi:NAD(P)-dependent oxidoreductase [Amycolatopsis ultiminotia]|uniref:NAD(P)-dependent oxidoreductase n=1 Tax=Amycolatopsis ultiminotia TaxID=543629 RepID=A0ABP6XVC1_9PSEU
MRVMVIGATGVLGVPAVQQLLTEGHEVSGLVRAESRTRAVRETGAKPVPGDVFDLDALTAALRGHDAVLNLATRIPAVKRAAFRSAWAENDRLRTSGTQTLAAAIRRVDEVGIVVQEGISLAYADGGESELDEEAPLDARFPTATSVVGHANIAALEADGRTAVRLRIATLVGDDAMTKAQLAAARHGAPLITGRRTAWTTAVHPDDAAAAAVAALRAPSGTYNVGATPVRKQQLGEAMAAAAGIPHPRALPQWAASLFGPMSVLARSQRIISTRLTEATGWQPNHRTPGPEWF